MFAVIESIRAAWPVRVIGKPEYCPVVLSGKLGSNKSHGAGSTVPSPPGFGRRRSSPKYLKLACMASQSSWSGGHKVEEFTPYYFKYRIYSSFACKFCASGLCHRVSSLGRIR